MQSSNWSQKVIAGGRNHKCLFCFLGTEGSDRIMDPDACNAQTHHEVEAGFT